MPFLNALFNTWRVERSNYDSPMKMLSIILVAIAIFFLVLIVMYKFLVEPDLAYLG